MFGSVTKTQPVGSHRRPSRKPLSTPPPWLRRGPMIKPLSLLNQRINPNVMVELKGGRGYGGILEGFEPHMNLVLRAGEETQDSQAQRTMDRGLGRGGTAISLA